MKMINKSLIKYYLKYAIFSTALIILIIQIYIILFEEEEYKDKQSKNNFFKFSTKAEYCKRKISTKYFDYFTKCFLAFFSGCLISEQKFLKFGAI
jgi:hypothetical protein